FYYATSSFGRRVAVNRALKYSRGWSILRATRSWQLHRSQLQSTQGVRTYVESERIEPTHSRGDRGPPVPRSPSRGLRADRNGDHQRTSDGPNRRRPAHAH